MTALFYTGSGVAVVASLLAVTRTNALHALLYLVVALFSLALVFLSLGAPFVAALEVIVYAGAIMVLILFVIMMLNQGRATERQERRWLQPAGWLVPLVLTGLLVAVVGQAVLGGGSESAVGPAPAIGPDAVGRSLFGTYLVAVELAALLLLAGLVGAYYLGTRE